MSYTLKLKNRGTSVISGIDLFDECHYGADKLFLRGNFCCPKCVGQQIKIALGDDELLDEDKLKEIYYGVTIDDTFKKTKLGIGNPLEQESDESGEQNIPTIALNRFHIPNKKFWNNTPPSGISNPYKASAAVTFSIRLYFRDDYAYITFGCPWSEIMDEESGEWFANYDESENGLELIKHFKLLKCHFISKDDAITVLQELGLEVTNWDKCYPTIETTQEVLELYDTDGSLIEI